MLTSAGHLHSLLPDSSGWSLLHPLNSGRNQSLYTSSALERELKPAKRQEGGKLPSSWGWRNQPRHASFDQLEAWRGKCCQPAFNLRQRLRSHKRLQKQHISIPFKWANWKVSRRKSKNSCLYIRHIIHWLAVAVGHKVNYATFQCLGTGDDA